MRFFIGFILFFSSFAAQADILFAPSFTYLKEETDSGSGSSERVRSGYDLRLGYFEKAGLYLGGMYSIYNVDDGGSEATMTSYGPSIGYKYRNGFSAILTYFVASEYDYGNGSVLEKGMGPQIDVAWMFNLSETVYLGPMISYRSIKYKESTSGGTTVDAETEFTHILPYVSMWFRF